MVNKFVGCVLIADNSDKKPKYVVDVGCGLGGTSRYMAKKYGATCQGITLSPKQAERAQALAKAEGLGQDKVDISYTIIFYFNEFLFRITIFNVFINYLFT